jgi:hypothetical protein
MGMVTALLRVVLNGFFLNGKLPVVNIEQYAIHSLVQVEAQSLGIANLPHHLRCFEIALLSVFPVAFGLFLP